MSAGGPVMSVALEAEIAKLKADLAAAEALVAKSAEKMGQTVKKNGIMSGTMQELKSTVRTVGDALNYAQVGLGSMVSLSETLRGNFEASQQSLERLPSVFGETARFGRMLFEALAGTADTLKTLADAESEVAGQDAFRKYAAGVAASVKRFQFDTSMTTERDPIKRIKMEQERAMDEMRLRFQSRGNESGKRYSDEIAKIREEEKKLADERYHYEVAQRAQDENMAIFSMSKAQLDEWAKKLEVRRAAARKQLSDESNLDTREMEAEANKIQTEFQAKLDAAYKAREAARRRGELQAEEEALRKRLKSLGSVNANDFLTSSQTALGTFTSGQANASAMVAKNMAEQLAIQKKIEENTKEQADLLKEIRDGGGGWQ